MPDSVQERIVTAITNAMLDITLGNGYDNTIASAQRFRWSGVDLSTMPTVLVKEGDCYVDFLKSTHQHIRRTMELFLVVCVRHDEAGDPRAGGTVLNSFVADIEKRLGATPTWGGLVLITNPPTYLEIEVDAETPHLARGLRCEIEYEHDRYNPYLKT